MSHVIFPNADGGTRMMIHIIGVSFTAEMAVKAAYEETIGRLTAFIRGRNKSPQDRAVAAVATYRAAGFEPGPEWLDLVRPA